MLRIALVIDDRDWHARALLKAFAARDVDAVAFRLADAAFDTAHPFGVALPGFGFDLPDAVLVRSISGGSFEEVTRRLGVLHALRELGVPVWNDARAIERCVDKSTTSFFLARAGISTPPTWTVEGRDAALAVARAGVCGGEAGAEAAVRLAGQGVAADFCSRTNCRRRRTSAGFTTCNAICRRARRPSATTGCSSARGRSSDR